MKQGSVEFKNNVCKTQNGDQHVVQRSRHVCESVYKAFHSSEASFGSLPWLNTDHVPALVISFEEKNVKWEKTAGLEADVVSAERRRLRAAGIQVLEAAQ